MWELFLFVSHLIGWNAGCYEGFCGGNGWYQTIGGDFAVYTSEISIISVYCRQGIHICFVTWFSENLGIKE